VGTGCKDNLEKLRRQDKFNFLVSGTLHKLGFHLLSVEFTLDYLELLWEQNARII
jgi:hypothetical protein